jgi:hypothetical protein
VVEAVDIEQRLLQRLSGGISPEELSEWARGILAFASAEGPSLFVSDEEMLLDILKRCAIEIDPGFELSNEDLQDLLRRMAFSDPARARRETPPPGPFLVALRAGMAPARLLPILANCARCGSPVRLSVSMLPKARQTRGLLACLWCAKAVPGNVVDRL